MKISINQDEWWPFYNLDDPDHFGGLPLEISNEEGESLKSEWLDIMNRLNAIQSKLSKYYEQAEQEYRKNHELPNK